MGSTTLVAILIAFAVIVVILNVFSSGGSPDNREYYSGEWRKFTNGCDGFSESETVQILSRRVNGYHYTLSGHQGLYSHSFLTKHTESVEQKVWRAED